MWMLKNCKMLGWGRIVTLGCFRNLITKSSFICIFSIIQHPMEYSVKIMEAPSTQRKVFKIGSYLFYKTFIFTTNIVFIELYQFTYFCIQSAINNEKKQIEFFFCVCSSCWHKLFIFWNNCKQFFYSFHFISAIFQ